MIYLIVYACLSLLAVPVRVFQQCASGKGYQRDGKFDTMDDVLALAMISMIAWPFELAGFVAGRLGRRVYLWRKYG